MLLYYSVILLLNVIIFTLILRIFLRLTLGRNNSNVCLVGKTALITGGNSGMGYQTALMLAGRGARIIIADKNDCTESKRKIIEETKNNNIVCKFLDLADFSTVRRFAGEMKNEEDRLDILINNAGVGGCCLGYTKDGCQLQMQVNHFGPFLLTHLLIDLLKKSAPSRIIFVSSIAAFASQLSVKNLNEEPDLTYWYGLSSSRFIQYNKSKLCNALSSIVFAEKLKDTGVTCNALHPGLVITSLLTIAMDINGIPLLTQFCDTLLKLFAKTAYEGAQTQTFLAMAQEVENVTGKFFIDCRPWLQPLKTWDKEYCKAIWKKSEELVKLAPHERL